jgi:hypothetical protein
METVERAMSWKSLYSGYGCHLFISFPVMMVICNFLQGVNVMTIATCEVEKTGHLRQEDSLFIPDPPS